VGYNSFVDDLKEQFKRPLANLLLSVADDKFVLGHRNADWTGLAPILEEDIAFSSLAQDELAHASALYQIAAGLLNTKIDKLAYGRAPSEYRCAQIVELSDEFDWATAIARNFFCDHFDFCRLNRLAASAYSSVAQLAARLVGEEKIHVDHVDSWIKRLGKGSDEARRRVEEALGELTDAAVMLFEPFDGLKDVEAAGIYPGDSESMFREWSGALHRVAADAGIRVELNAPKSDIAGGRHGKHSDAFRGLLDELTEVYRIEPEAAW
jgi:ring-1,2-phenylacetyl-CoA epoxidase subunit PaaC